MTVIVLSRASVVPAIVSEHDGPLRLDVRYVSDLSAMRDGVQPASTCAVLMDVSVSGGELFADCQGVADTLPACARVGFVYSVRLLTRWHLEALCRGQLQAIVDGFVTPTGLRDVLIAAARGSMILRVNADFAHTTTLMPTAAHGGIDLETVSDDDRIVALSALGWSERQIGLTVHLSASAVHHRLERVRARLGLRNRIELAAWAGQMGLYRTPGNDAGTTSHTPSNHTTSAVHPDRTSMRQGA